MQALSTPIPDTDLTTLPSAQASPEALRSDPKSAALPGSAMALFAATALAACGGGGSSDSPALATSTTPAPVPVPTPAPAPTPAPTPSAPPTNVQAARLLLQSQFSASTADIASVQSLGYAAWLDLQFNAATTTTGWDWLMSQGYNDISFINSSAPADYMAWNQTITSADALRKRVALALSEIFVVSSSGINIQWRHFAMAAYWDTLAANAFGTYRSLLNAVTLNPAMGAFLNTKGNQKEDLTTGRQPDENYAREVMQLLAIGVYNLNIDGSLMLDASGKPIESYNQSTITNLAKAFTGWDLDNTGATATNPLQFKTPMALIASRHSTAAMTFLGTTIPANTDGTAALKTTLDTLANHPNTAPFISKQLIQRLVTSNPSAAYVGRVAAVFNDNGSGVRGDLKAVIKTLLLDTEARSDIAMTQPTWGKLREPMLRLVQWARTFNATSTSGKWQIGDLSDGGTRLGQSPLRSSSVFNFFRPGYVPPNTALAAAALVGPEFQITNESTVAGYINFMTATVRSGIADVLSSYSTELTLVNDTTALTDRLNLLLCAGQLSSATLASISTAIGTISTSTTAGQQNRVYAAVLLTMASPQYIVQK